MSSELGKRLRSMAEIESTLSTGSDNTDEKIYHAEIAADLLAAAEIVERATWKPISEAPRDRPIDVWEPRNGRTADAKWVDGQWCEWGPGSFDTMCWVYIRPEPTHYRPLPAPPQVKP